jgi:putative transposase
MGAMNCAPTFIGDIDMHYNPEIHHRRSIRLKEYDYSRVGFYFVTICTNERQCLFGEVVENVVKLNDMGKIVQTTWDKLPLRFQNVEVDESIVMPNHPHGIIVRNLMVDSNINVPELGQIIRAFKAVTTRYIRTSCLPEFAWQRNYHERIIRKNGELDRVRQYIVNNPVRWNDAPEM